MAKESQPLSKKPAAATRKRGGRAETQAKPKPRPKPRRKAARPKKAKAPGLGRLLQRALAIRDKAAGRARAKGAVLLSSTTRQVMYGLALGLVLSGLVIWLLWPLARTPLEPPAKPSAKAAPGPPGPARPEPAQPKAVDSAKVRPAETAPAPTPVRPAEARPRPPAETLPLPPNNNFSNGAKGPAYEEEGPAFHRQLARTDARLLATLKELGLTDQAVRFSRVKNVVEGSLYYERVELGLTLTDQTPERLAEGLLQGLSALDFPATVTASASDSLEVRVGGHLTHLLRLERLKPLPSLPPREPAREKLPLAAIIIDDLGYHPKLDAKFIDLDLGLTVAVLPLSPSGQRAAQAAQARGREVMLHAPMEPHGYPKTNPGPGALLTTMAGGEIKAALDRLLDDLPQARGVNKHMGSRFTEESEPLKAVMAELKRRQMFFVDSRTTPKSQALEAAAGAGVRSAARSIFLDNVVDPAAIRAQVSRLIALAQSEGQAIAIGHPHAATSQVLLDLARELRTQVQLVPASRLVK
jgi:polysaccharide deacetylase 2 family uncharacterized protein YibQ